MKEYPFLNLAECTASRSEELKQAAARVIDSGRYLNGPETTAFASELAAYCGAPAPALCTSNGLDALRLMTRALLITGRLQEGDEVIVPANTYIASILPLLEFGLIPVPVEPASDDFCLDFQAARKAISGKTRAVLLVHLYGNPCWDAAFASMARDKGILLLEDNAQAIGADASAPGLNGTRRTGTLADAAAFSFYPTKNLGALGDAGALLSPHQDIMEAAEALANYGSDRRYHNIYRGYNCRMDEIQAAMLRVGLSRLEDDTQRRREAAEAYSSAISHPDVITPRIFTDRRQVWHQYPIHTPRREALREYLKRNGVGTDIHYATPPHLQPCLRGTFSGPFPITEHLADTEISLPIAGISASDALTIAEIINEFE